MHPAKLICTLAFILCGCATTAPGGNFVTEGDQTPLAADAVHQLASLYPPAHTALALQQPTTDPFGTALVNGLRARGYQVAEYVPANPREDAPRPQAGTALRYVLDAAGDIYRLTLFVGDQAISRPYTAHAGSFTPVGAWSRKE